jgi:hypothetical protein
MYINQKQLNYVFYVTAFIERFLYFLSFGFFILLPFTTGGTRTTGGETVMSGISRILSGVKRSVDRETCSALQESSDQMQHFSVQY